MEEKIAIHGNPNGSVFGLIGNDASTDEGKFYVKISDESKNKGWREIPPTPSPTPTVSLTPSKTPIVTRTATPIPSQTPTITPTISVTPTVTPSSIPGSSPTPTPTVTNTSFKTSIPYTIVATTGGTAQRIDGPTPSGIISVGTGEMYLQALPDSGYYFKSWDVPESVILTSPYSLSPVATGFNTLDSVTITAIFEAGSLPMRKINAIANSRGIVIFTYINDLGEEIEYLEGGFPAGATVSGIVCGYVVTSGNAYITSNSC